MKGFWDLASAGPRPGLALLVLAAALLVCPDRSSRASSLRGGRGAARASRGFGDAVDPRLRRWVLPIGAVVVGLLIAPSVWWLGLGAGVALAVLARPARGSPRERARRRRRLILHAQLLAGCLDSGLAMAPALRAVGDVLGPSRTGDGWAPENLRPSLPDPLAALESVAAMLSLGADADTAWRVVDADDDLAPLAAAARRSAAGGTTLADAVREHADQLRREAREEAARSAGRAGVLMTAPLGVCFLPAFLCLGLAPVIIGLLAQLTIG